MNLRSAITIAARIAGNGTLPILATVRFCKGRIIATDLMQQIEIPVELPPGLATADVCVHANRLLRILKALPEAATLEAKLMKDPVRVQLRAGNTRFELNTLPAEDFPGIANQGECQSSTSLESKPIVAALEFAEKAMAIKDIRYYLCGMHFRVEKAAITITATDGHRLHRVRVPLEPDPKRKPAEAIAGAATIARIIELAGQHSEIEIQLGDGQLVIHANTETLALKLIDGTFPDSERVIPTSRPCTASVPREAFADSLKRVMQIYTDAADKLQGVALKFTSEAIEITATNKEGEIATENFEWNASARALEPLTMGFNGHYLLEAFEAFPGERVNLHLPETDGDSLYLTDDDAGRRQAVIMPARI